MWRDASKSLGSIALRVNMSASGVLGHDFALCHDRDICDALVVGFRLSGPVPGRTWTSQFNQLVSFMPVHTSLRVLLIAC